MRTNRRWTQRLLPTAIAISLLTGRANVAHAGLDQWTSSGPTNEGGIVTALAIDPQTPSTLYAGTANDGVFKSTTGGASWSAANNFGLPVVPTATARRQPGDSDDRVCGDDWARSVQEHHWRRELECGQHRAA